MIRITAENKIDTMDRRNAPAAYCEPGDTVLFETVDCADGAVNEKGERDRTPGKYMHNPATGPLFVRGAHPGDILRVHICSIRLAGRGFMGTGFGSDCFRNIPGERIYRSFDLTAGTVTIGSKTFATRPMIGVIGVAPEGEGVDTMTPLRHGGNMDCTMIGEGADVYFPVYTEGALLAMGDLHAAMGDGEVFQYGLECGGEVTVEVSVLPGTCLRMPAVVRNGSLAAVASADTLEECSELAVRQIFDILVENGWDRTDAGMLMRMRCDLAICQTVDPKLTVRASIPVELVKA